MMNLNFLPSRRIAIYMARLFATRSLAVLIMLVMVLMALDLLGESGKILAVPGNGEPELWRYVGLRVPMLASRFLPFAVLLGTLIALTTLNQNSEVVAMKAAGMSAHQVLAPMILASLLLAAVAFAFNETVVVRASRTVEAWSGADYKPIPPDTGVLTNVWARNREQLVHVDLVAGRDREVRLEGVTIYQRKGGTLEGMIDAPVARQRPGGWRLYDAKIYDTGMNVVRKAATIDTLDGVEATRFTLARINAASEDFGSLERAIDDLDRAGRPTAAARSGWWHKISGPFSIVLMPLLAGLAGFGLARSGQVLVRAAIGMALGFTYFLVDNLSLALGNVGAYPPMLAAWAPFMLFLFIGEMVLVRSEE